MITGEQYYIGNHDILNRKRTIIGKDGQTQFIDNLPNNKIVDNQYSRVVDQKNSYLLSKPLTFYSDNKEFLSILRSILDKNFFRTFKNIGEDSINCGISWLYVFINQSGNIDFKRFKPFEVLPFWDDDDHTKLTMLARIYDIQQFSPSSSSFITKVELFTLDGIYYFFLQNGQLVPDSSNPFSPYIIDNKNSSLSWDFIPVIPFKYNSKELPLINKVKSLQDALNTVRSDFMNNIQEDARNTILVLKNYDGTNLSEFRKNLSEFGVVKVKTVDGHEGGVEALKINVDHSNFEILAKSLKRSIIENARGYDSRDDRIGSNPNQMNIQSVYSDIDLDAGLMETEFQASFQILFHLIKKFIKFSKKLDFFEFNVDVIFNKDILINESEAISNCIKSSSILSKETILSQHPWVTQVDSELERLSKS